MTGYCKAFDDRLLNRDNLYSVITYQDGFHTGYYYSESLKVILKIIKLTDRGVICYWDGKEWRNYYAET
jgi:hypothetical protein